MTFNLKSIKRVFHQDNISATYGTFWPYSGGYITAEHVTNAMNDYTPSFTRGGLRKSGGLVDAVTIGAKKPKRRPREPEEGERVSVYGFPAGSRYLERRTGIVYLRRTENASKGYETPSWIVILDEAPKVIVDGYKDNYFEPVVSGMSGGAVIDHQGKPLGVLITRGGAFDSNSNEVLEQTMDFQALSDIYDALFGDNSYVV